MNTLRSRTAACALSLAGALALLAAPPARADEALYQQFGGDAGVQNIADDFITNVYADPRTAPYFAKASVKRLRVQLASHFCASLGGPCQYTGSSMKNVHAPLHIDRAAFNAVVENLQKSMDKNQVPFRAQNRLLAVLAPLYRDIENPRGAPSVVPLREPLPAPDDPAEAAPADPTPPAAPAAVAP